ncbi:hypothetical protein [Paenibacillus albus]|uniref:Uncharacterized protein n=1 Tax=Paenibacillus albus TaxID=2495582 RepID=A0A3S9A491_9BACL|nr:hypothetical protein [Paenibacillus albus]AZN40539.1 hypothetical protein EJC50_13380 [Paenibacillus albus]
MKRYWFSILLVIFILGSVGTYYVTAASRSFPEYKLLTVSGDDNEAKSLEIQGDSKEYGSLDITAKGSVYFQERSFFDSFKENEMFKYSPDLQQMLKDHRNFMRGKKTYNGFYQDAKVLAYADIKGGNNYNNRKYQLSVSTLDLAANDKISFTVSLPEQEKYVWVNTADVQVKGKTMYVLTYNLNKSSGNQQEIHVYKVDLNKKSIAEDQLMLADKRMDDGTSISYQLLQSSQSSASTELLVYQKSTQTFTKDKDGNEQLKGMEQEIFTYNYATGKSESVKKLPATTNSDSANDYVQVYGSGESIIELANGGTSTNVKIFNVIDKSERSFEIPSISSPTSVVVYGDRLYAAKPDGDTTKVVIADLTRGKVVYTGTVDINEQGDKRAKLLKNLDFQWMYIVK